MNAEFRLWIFLLLLLFFQLAGLSFAVLLDSYMKKRQSRLLLAILAFTATLIIQNYAEFIAADHVEMYLVRRFLAAYGYCIRPVVLVLFMQILDESRNLRAAYALVGINAFVSLTIPFSGISIEITRNNEFRRGPLGYTCHIISFILLLWLVQMSIREFTRLRKYEAIMPVFIALVVIGATIMDLSGHYDFPVSCLSVSMVNGCVFFYTWLHLQFVRDHEEDLRSKQRIRVMISQIQPHFLFNTLSTIQALCLIDPRKASATTEKFGSYLRQNIDSLNQTGLIPFTKELEHTRIYAEIEMIRFPYITIEYDIEDRDFSLPALTVQPLVENAIRHGVRIREKGVVKILSRKEGEGHYIEVRDNGKGFDVEKALNSDETHIGLRNVKERIEQMCHGEFRIDSRPGEGTSVKIYIKSENDSECA